LQPPRHSPWQSWAAGAFLVAIAAFISRPVLTTLIDPPDPFSLEGVENALQEQAIGVIATDPQPGELEKAQAVARVESRISANAPSRRRVIGDAYSLVLSVRHPIMTVRSWVIEITGPRTGNCFLFLEMATGRQWGASCFFADRTELLE
jgi:hypothetical protein